MELVKATWAKLNSRERLVARGAAVVIVAWIVSLADGFGFGTGSLPLVAALAVLAIYYLKYAPNQSISWPAPIPTIVLGISGIAAALAILSALGWVGLLGGLFGGLYLVALISVVATAVGAGMMAYGAWQEYQAAQQPAA